MGKLPKYYCKKCGVVCRVTIKPDKGYDSKTGKQNKPDYLYRCPNYSGLDVVSDIWWPFRTPHFNEIVTEDIAGNFFYDAGNEFGPFYIKTNDGGS